MSRLSRMKLGGIFAGSALQFVFWEGSQERSKKALDYVSVKSRQGLLWEVLLLRWLSQPSSTGPAWHIGAA